MFTALNGRSRGYLAYSPFFFDGNTHDMQEKTVIAKTETMAVAAAAAAAAAFLKQKISAIKVVSAMSCR